MDKKQIQEIDDREKAKCEYLLEKNRKKKRSSVLDFFPELRLRGVCGYFMFGQPVWLLIPYLDVVIVNIAPYKNEKALEAKLGLSVKTLLDLERKGRIQLLLDTSPLEYTNLDFLDPIIGKSGCSDYRLSAFSHCLTSRFKGYCAEGEKVFDGRLGGFAEEVGWSKFVKRPAKELEGTASTLYAQLLALGYHDLCKELSALAQEHPALAYRKLYVYARFLTDPTFYSLDGINPIETEYAKMKEYCDECSKWEPRFRRRILPFSHDVGKAILENLKLRMPNDLEQALNIPTDKARRALSELDNVVTKKAGEKIVDRKMALEFAFMETNEAIRSVDAKVARISRKKFKRVADAGIVTIGVTGIVAANLIGAPLLSSIAATLGIETILAMPRFVRQLPEAVMKLRKPSHVIAFYDIQKRIGQ
jgi:hypothetical protein